MSLYEVSNLKNIGLELVGGAAKILDKGESRGKKTVTAPKTTSYSALSELSFNIDPPQYVLKESEKEMGLFLKEIVLNESFEGFIANAFDASNELYFTSICWDYSGEKPFVFPPKGANPADFLITLKQGKKREFTLGSGVGLFPSRKVKGALNILMLVYECDSDVRDVGETLELIHDSVDKSTVTSIVTTIASNASMATAIIAAVSALMGGIGKIMKNNKDDYVDFFSGTYGTDRPWQTIVQAENHYHSSIKLELRVS